MNLSTCQLLYALALVNYKLPFSSKSWIICQRWFFFTYHGCKFSTSLPKRRIYKGLISISVQPNLVICLWLVVTVQILVWNQKIFKFTISSVTGFSLNPKTVHFDLLTSHLDPKISKAGLITVNMGSCDPHLANPSRKPLL